MLIAFSSAPKIITIAYKKQSLSADVCHALFILHRTNFQHFYGLPIPVVPKSQKFCVTIELPLKELAPLWPSLLPREPGRAQTKAPDP